ncbi:DUF3325 domain-containing protein [Halopseudomonas sabulinigri]|uniref:DUF3325 domain-containing protein n=1 Tax=Halopseudomonas sabulinigri TaxID=472181 RepID=A0ABP9ZSB0_9GAMM
MSLSLLGLALALTYSGMLALCLAMERHWKQLAAGWPASWRRACRPLGCLLLLLACYLMRQLWPPAMAWVAWLGLMSLSGASLLFLLPYAPRLVLGLPLLTGLLAGLGTLGQ